MEKFKRFAVYYAPEAGPFADATAQWLGWDPVTGTEMAQPELGVDLAALTADPRKYGFHGTIKPPFRLADGVDAATLGTAVAALARSLSPVQMPGLQFLSLAGFLALVPTGDTAALSALAATVVTVLDPLRAPLTAAERARRRPDRLTPRQCDLLDHYGYPYVLEEFQFHLTLTGALPACDLAATRAALAPHLLPLLPEPFLIRDLCLCGEGEDGLFRILHRYVLTG